jgi:hypothetical protein
VAKAFSGLGVTAGLAADRSAMTGMSTGQVFMETDTKREWVYDGTRWVQTNQYSTTSGVTGVSNLIVPPTCKIYRTTTQAIPNGGPTAIQMTGGALWDTDAMFSSGANTLITVNTAGLYLFSAQLTFAANATGSRFVQIQKAGATVCEAIVLPNATYTPRVTMSYMDDAAVGATYNLAAFQDIGGNLNVSACELSAVWIGRKS